MEIARYLLTILCLGFIPVFKPKRLELLIGLLISAQAHFYLPRFSSLIPVFLLISALPYFYLPDFHPWSRFLLLISALPYSYLPPLPSLVPVSSSNFLAALFLSASTSILVPVTSTNFRVAPFLFALPYLFDLSFFY